VRHIQYIPTDKIVQSIITLPPHSNYKPTNETRIQSKHTHTHTHTPKLPRTTPNSTHHRKPTKKRHLQHAQVKGPQDSRDLRQSQHERLRQIYRQPPVQRARHQDSRLHGRQSGSSPGPLLQEHRYVEAAGSARQEIMARHKAEGADLTAKMRSDCWVTGSGSATSRAFYRGGAGRLRMV
jgi:hypothetical protein